MGSNPLIQVHRRDTSGSGREPDQRGYGLVNLAGRTGVASIKPYDSRACKPIIQFESGKFALRTESITAIVAVH